MSSSKSVKRANSYEPLLFLTSSTCLLASEKETRRSNRFFISGKLIFVLFLIDMDLLLFSVPPPFSSFSVISVSTA